MRFIFTIIVSTWVGVLSAQEIFTKKDISKYLTMDNPFVYSEVAQRFIYKHRENYQLGNFDTALRAKYDKKDYPLSDGEFYSAGMVKPMENGIEFSADYRYAEGEQEYNNIKTGDEGEVLVGVKVPVLSVIEDINERKLNLYASRLDTEKVNYKANDNIRLLYAKVVSHYYTLLHLYQKNILVSDLVNYAEDRAVIITKRVKVGSLAQLALLEVQQQIINRKQRLLRTQTEYENALEKFVQYLNITKDEFNRMYILPPLMQMDAEVFPYELSLQEALENRPDLKIYDNEIKQLELKDKFNGVSAYPVLDVGVYGVHDFEEKDDGYKLTFDFNFPLQRRQYTSRSLEIKNEILHIRQQKERKVSMLKTDLKLIHNSISMFTKNIENSKLEVELVEKIQDAENKKYLMGLSNLFMVNQREIYTLEVRKKLLQYKVDYLLVLQRLNRVMGRSLEGFE